MLCLFFLYYLKAALEKQIVHWDGFSGVFVLCLTEWFFASIKKQEQKRKAFYLKLYVWNNQVNVYVARLELAGGGPPVP